MMFPLVTYLARDGVPVQVACGVLGFSRQAYYQWLTSKPVMPSGNSSRVLGIRNMHDGAAVRKSVAGACLYRVAPWCAATGASRGL